MPSIVHFAATIDKTGRFTERLLQAGGSATAGARAQAGGGDYFDFGTPFHAAGYYGNTASAKVLMQHGARDVRVYHGFTVDGGGQINGLFKTPSELATQQGHPDTRACYEDSACDPETIGWGCSLLGGN